MAIDEVSTTQTSSSGSGGGGKFALVIVALAALALGEIYTISQLGSIRGSVESQQAAFKKELAAQIDQQISTQVAELEKSNAQQFEALKTEVSKKVPASGGGNRREIRQTRALLEQVQNEQKVQAEQFQQQISTKADQQQLGTLTQDVSATRSDLENTKKVLDSTRADLGMARSELGTLIGRNHDDIEQLRKMGEREYFEFVLDRNVSSTVAGVGLTLKKANLKRFRYTLTLAHDDMVIEKKDRNVNEPIFFYPRGSKRFFELVVNKIESNKVSGYLSTPKGAVEVASRSGGAR